MCFFQQDRSTAFILSSWKATNRLRFINRQLFFPSISVHDTQYWLRLELFLSTLNPAVPYPHVIDATANGCLMEKKIPFVRGHLLPGKVITEKTDQREKLIIRRKVFLSFLLRRLTLSHSISLDLKWFELSHVFFPSFVGFIGHNFAQLTIDFLPRFGRWWDVLNLRRPATAHLFSYCDKLALSSSFGQGLGTVEVVGVIVFDNFIILSRQRGRLLQVNNNLPQLAQYFSRDKIATCLKWREVCTVQNHELEVPMEGV